MVTATSASIRPVVSSGIRDLLRYGNAVWMIGRDNRGAVQDLTYVPWSWLGPRVVDVDGQKTLVFDV